MHAAEAQLRCFLTNKHSYFVLSKAGLCFRLKIWHFALTPTFSKGEHTSALRSGVCLWKQAQDCSGVWYP